MKYSRKWKSCRYLPIELLLILMFFGAASAEDYSEWNYSQTITLNTTASGANITGDVSDFPLLLRLDPGTFSFFAQTLPGGADIRFAKTSGEHLSYQIERWVDKSSNNDTAEIWVKIDTVYGNNSTQKFVMYWGKSGAADSSNSGDVFKTGNGFMVTYHLAGNLNDASGNNITGTDSGTIDTSTGIIGHARSFNGNSFFSAGDLPDRASGTISCWFRTGSTFNSSVMESWGLWGKKENDGTNSSLCLRGIDFINGNGNPGQIQAKIEKESTGSYINSTTQTFTGGTWYHVAWSWTNSAESLFVNGVPEKALLAGYTVSGSADDEIGGTIFDLVNMGTEKRHCFYGTIDEFRIDNTFRCANWIKLCYENQKTGQKLIVNPPPPGSYTWDVSTDAGIQSGSGAWGTSSNWSLTGGSGTALFSWAGSGSIATFAGNKGSYTITVNGKQYADSISFLDSGYTLNSGTVNLQGGSGIYTGDSIAARINSVIAGSGGLSKYGSGQLHLYGSNTYAGTTNVTAGALLVNGSIAAGSPVTVQSGATLGGTGTCSGPVNVNGGSLEPGISGPGKLSTGALVLNASSVLNFDLGTRSDTIAVDGGLVLNGTANFYAVDGFAPGTYRLMTFTGPLTDNTIAAGTVPAGMDVFLFTGSGYLSAIVTEDGLIRKQPADTLALAGRGASFTVEAEGIGTLAYKWQRYPSDSVGNAAALLMASVTRADSGLLYRCIVRDSLLRTDTSRWALLSVIDTPRIALQPQNVSATAGADAVFSIEVSNNNNVNYAWRKTGDATVLGTGSTFTISEAGFDDSGSFYYCMVTNAAATVNSDTVKLTVLHVPPSITAQPLDQTVLVGDSAFFSIAATGNAPPMFAWRKVGSDTVLGSASSFTIKVTKFSDSGSYYCVVKNPAATLYSDTVTLVIRHKKPVAAFTFEPKTGLTPLKVTFTNASSGDIDSYLWRFGDTGTAGGGSSDKKNPAYSYAKGGQYTVTLIVKGPGGVDSLVKKDSIFAYNQGSNPVRMTARYLSGTDVEITVTGINSIDTLSPAPECDSMGIWIKPRALPSGSSDGTLALRYKRSVFKGTQIIDTLTLPASDSVFGLMSGLFWHDGSISGFLETNGIIVMTRDTIRPDNVCTISAVPIAGDSIHVTIANCDSIDTGRVDSLCVWYGTDTAAITTAGTNVRWFYRNYFYNSAEKVITLRDPLFTGTSHKMYAAVALKGKNGRISKFKTATFVTIPAVLQTGNPIVIDTLYYDSLAASLKISWCGSEAGYDDEAQVGITYGFGSFPEDTARITVIPNLSRCIDTTMPLHEPVCFGCLYYVALWYRLPDGMWVSPTAESKKTVSTGAPFREIVNWFDSGAINDTVKVFNGKVLLWKDGSYTGAIDIDDTLEIITLNNVPDGMIPAGVPFRFRKGDPCEPVYIGISIDSFPDGKTISDVRMYSDSSGKWCVIYETMVDSVNGVVYIKTGNLRQSFIAMIDTLPPVVTIYSDVESPVAVTEKFTDSIGITDNIANVRWKYYYGKGDEVPRLRVQGDMLAAGKKLVLSIPDTIKVVSSGAGLRVLMEIDDGVNKAKFNLSRSVIRLESDKFTTYANVWNPVCPSAVLMDKNAGSLVSQLLKHENLNAYDRRHIRLYRWLNCEMNARKTDKWVEYDQGNVKTQSLFTLEPGRMFWLKTRSNIPLHLDSGYTLSLRDTFTIELPGMQWTDFGMPYQFGVRMEEILSASGTDADSILFFCWKQDSNRKSYSLEPLYVPGMPDCVDRSKTIDYVSGGGYSFYNQQSKTVTLRIPPVLPAMGKKLTKTAKERSGAWSMKFVAQTDDVTRLPAVYFGYAPGVGKSLYPLSPSFSLLSLSVFNRQNAVRYGHHIGEDAKNGLVRELVISNDADTAQSIRYHLEETGAFPESYLAYSYNAAAKTLDTCGTITLAPKTTASRWIVIGDAEFQKGFISTVSSQQYSLHTLYPNPSRSIVNIRYSVPFGTQERIKIAIYNVLGKRVWDRNIDGLLDGGFHLVSWNGKDSFGNPAGSGLYIVRLAVVNKHGKPVKQFEKRVTLIR